MTVENGTDRTGGEDRGVHELVTHQLNIANGSHHAGRATDPCCVSGQLNGTGLARPPVRSRPRPG